MGLAAAGGIVVLPLLLGDELQEAVDAFVDPRPLTLVRVDDHGEVEMAHLVDHHADQEALCGPGVGALTVLAKLRSRAVRST